MEVTNLTGLEQPLVKLIETVSEGVGVVGNHLFGFDVAKIKRIGAAEAEAEKMKIVAHAEAQETAIEVLGRAEKRFALEQYNKQINLENILVKTRDDLVGKTVSSEPVEKDWTMRFLDIAQNVSREELQQVLAKILSGEIQCPGTFSYQSLETIKYLSKSSLDTFLKFVAISCRLGIPKLSGNGKASLEPYGLSFSEYLDLCSLGLFNPSSTLNFDIDVEPDDTFDIEVGKETMTFVNNGKAKKTFDPGIYAFSSVGKEIRSVALESAANPKAGEYKEKLLKLVQDKGFELSKK